MTNKKECICSVKECRDDCGYCMTTAVDCPSGYTTRLAYLRQEIEAERISQSEIIELQSLARYIDPGDTLLLEWAGVEEK